MRVHVSLQGTVAGEFRMPAWSPGDYRIVNFGANLTDVRFTRENESVEATRGSDVNLWTIQAGADSVSYTIRAVPAGDFSENLRVKQRELFIHGPAVLGYFEGHIREPHELRVKLTPADAIVECALERVKSNDPEFAVFKAPDYDVLADSPVVMGSDIKVKEFTVRGKAHAVVAFGRNSDVDLESFAEVGKAVAEQCSVMFGELPYKRYLFLYDFGGPGGGLEHADCARMGIYPGMSARQCAAFIAHEFFHLFNVKRIRPKPLGPFDYTKPALTGDIWWLEGVTEYYSELILYRVGLQSRLDLLNHLSTQIRSLERNPARLKVSADESSRRVWEAKNSSGYGGLDYYQKGELIGLCLDLAIRAESAGSRSLDDVMVALYNECKNGKPGFSAGRIRELCVLFGGEALGPVYDGCVVRAQDLPIRTLLPRLGMAWHDGRIVEDAFADETARRLRETWPATASHPAPPHPLPL